MGAWDQNNVFFGLFYEVSNAKERKWPKTSRLGTMCRGVDVAVLVMWSLNDVWGEAEKKKHFS